MLIVGTAGHIDHGKSSIVRRLTGTDPDRLPEEKERGLTIDLGFAFYSTPDNDTVAFVDVPGHERFVKNMVAGVGGIDAVMLVIAADDGWMPQSEEHFQIVRLLNIRNGMIVINKIDLAKDPEWLDLLEQDIQERIQGSFLEGSPVFRVSSQTGDGFDGLRAHLDRLSSTLGAQKDIGKARLYIDRSFVRPGIGGVVTGTLRGGTLSVGETISIWPQLKQGKIRSLHSNNREVTTAVPGQRTAVGFTGIDKEDLIRGGVVSRIDGPDYFRKHSVLALSVELLPRVEFPLTDRRRVLFIVGTSEVEGEIRLLEGKEIKPGEQGIVYLKPDEPVLTLVGDRFIIRLPTPMVTLGGGQVLDQLRHYPRKKHADRYIYLAERIPMRLEKLIVSELKKQTIVPMGELLVYSDYAREAIEAAVKVLWQKKEVRLFEGAVYHVAHLGKVVKQFSEELHQYLEQHPHLKGLTVDQMSDITDREAESVTWLSKYLVSEGEMVKLQDKYNLAGRGMALKGPIKAAHDELMQILKAEPYAPPNLSLLAGKGKAHKDAIKFMLETQEGYKVGSDFVFLTETWLEVVRFIRATLNERGRMAVTELKDKFGFTRKYAIPILEETDRIGLTNREGDVRVKGRKFESEDFTL